MSPPQARRRWTAWAMVVILPALLVWDLRRPPTLQSTTRWLLAGIDLYQATVSPAMDALGVRCRFQPSCSHYGEEVIRRDGALIGVGKAAWRVARCGPWTPWDTPDPP